MAARAATQERPPAPGPKTGPGTLLGILRDPLGQLEEFVREYGPVVRFRIGGRVNHLVADPDLVKHVLVDNHAHYSKGRTFEKTRAYLGNGLATSAGSHWRRQRRIMQPHFHKKQIAAIGQLMALTIAETAEAWRDRARGGETFDVWPDMMSMALNVVARSLFGAELEDEVRRVARSFQVALEHTTKRVLAPLEIPNWLPTVGNIRFRRAIAELDEIVYRVIEDREREGPDGRADLLSVLLHASDDDTGERMSPRQLRDEIMTLFLGGHEATGNALAFTWYLLSKSPEARARMVEEIDQLGGEAPTIDALPRLTYTAQVFQETMRIYPQNWVMSRDTVEDDEIGGYHIPAGTSVFLGVYAVHRDPAHWPEPERFDPDRFSAERSRGRHPGAYVPFGAGQRKCIGANFATMEATLALATLAQRFRVELDPDYELALDPKFALRPKGGVRVRVAER